MVKVHARNEVRSNRPRKLFARERKRKKIDRSTTIDFLRSTNVPRTIDLISTTNESTDSWINAEDLSPFPNSDQFGTCSYNAKSILLHETPVMEAQVHFGYLRFTDEIGITVCSPIPVPDFCLPSFKVHLLGSQPRGRRFRAQISNSYIINFHRFLCFEKNNQHANLSNNFNDIFILDGASYI